MSVYQAPVEVYRLISSGDKNGPRKFPTVDWTTVNAVLPWACRVMTILDDMVVGTQPVKIIPTSRPGSMKSRFVEQAETIPKAMADVIRKLWSCTKR